MADGDGCQIETPPPANPFPQVPGCFIRHGGMIADREIFPAHSAQFDFDEAALAFGAAWLARVAVVAGDRVLAANAGGSE